MSQPHGFEGLQQDPALVFVDENLIAGQRVSQGVVFKFTKDARD